jgi:putative endonuclease
VHFSRVLLTQCLLVLRSPRERASRRTGRENQKSNMVSASIYILLCADGSYYTGITRRTVEERVSEHAQGLIPGSYTATRLPVRLVFSESYERVDEAVAAERRIKGWSRAKKEAYMRGDYEALPGLSKRGGKQASRMKPSFETRPSGAPQDEGVDAMSPRPEEPA